MTRRFLYVGAVLCLSAGLQAATITVTMGSATPSFANGQTGIGTGTYNAAVAGNSAPFNGFIGSDVNGPDFSASWTYSYAAIGAPISSATLTLGTYDADSSGTGNQVGSFLLGGVDLTALLNTEFEATPGASGGYYIYSITLPGTTFAALAAGTPALSLSLQNGAGVLGDTPFNGAGLDFSTLTITTREQGPEVPEPATMVLTAVGIAALAGLRRIRGS